MVLLEINVGLIVGTAIIASLLNLYVKEESYNRALSKAINLLSVSAILSGIALYLSIAVFLYSYLPGYYDTASIDFFDAILTALSILLFIWATELLFRLAGSRVSQTQKKQKKKE